MICVVCAHPDRIPDRGQVCPGCAHGTACDLRDIADLYVELITDREALANRPYEVIYRDADGNEQTQVRGVDPLSGVIPSHAQTSASRAPRVTGSRDAPLPLNVDALDLSLPARGGTIHDQHGDQHGEISVATILDQWVDDWREHRGKGEGRPLPIVVILADWLGVRLADACDDHPAIDEFAADMRKLARTLRRVIGDGPVRPERLVAPCPGCDLLALVRDHDGVRCRACGEQWTDDQYGEWVGLLAQDARMAA